MEQNMRFGMTLGWLAILNIVYLGNETIVHKNKNGLQKLCEPIVHSKTRHRTTFASLAKKKFSRLFAYL